MTSHQDKINRRRKQANQLDALHELGKDWIYEFDSLAYFPNREDAIAFENHFTDVLTLYDAISKHSKQMLQSWIDEDVRDHWPPDDWQLPDGTGS